MMAVEIYDYNSKDFAKTVKVCGREYMVLEVLQNYECLNYDSYSPYSVIYGGNCIRVPDLSINLRLRPVPPPPPPAPRRTWSSAMGLRRPTR